MATYEVPAELFEFYARIKTPLARRVAILILSDKTANASYRQACKELKRKLSKDPRKSAYQIATNIDVARFVNLARKKRQTAELHTAQVSFNQRTEYLNEIIKLKLSRARASAEPVNCSDAVAAIKTLNDMYQDDEFDGLSDDELKAAAGEE